MTRHYCTGLGPVSPDANRCCKQHDKVDEIKLRYPVACVSR